MKKKRSKLQWLACLLVVAVMMTVGTPTILAHAMDDDAAGETPSTEIDLIDEGPGGQYGNRSALGLRVGSTPTVHGNSLSSTATNYGYALVDKTTNTILKFGETIHPQTRYTQSYLNTNNAAMNILESGSKTSIHMWQYDMNSYYKSKYGEYPPLNKRGW